MITQDNNPKTTIKFIKTSTSDYLMLNRLLDDPLYKFVKKNLNGTLTGIIPFTSNINAKGSKTCETSQNEFNYMIYNEDQQFVGYIKGYYPVSENNLWIQILMVNKPFIGMGYGKNIINETIQTLSKIGPIKQIYLTCHRENKQGIRFWNSVGFEFSAKIKETHSLYKANLRSLTCIPNHLKH